MIYLINYDNAYHLKYKMQTRGDIAKDVVTEKYVLGMRILMLGYEHASRIFKGGSQNGIGEFTDDFRRMAARDAACFGLTGLPARFIVRERYRGPH